METNVIIVKNHASDLFPYFPALYNGMLCLAIVTEDIGGFRCERIIRIEKNLKIVKDSMIVIYVALSYYRYLLAIQRNHKSCMFA